MSSKSSDRRGEKGQQNGHRPKDSQPHHQHQKQPKETKGPMALRLGDATTPSNMREWMKYMGTEVTTRFGILGKIFTDFDPVTKLPRLPAEETVPLPLIPIPEGLRGRAAEAFNQDALHPDNDPHGLNKAEHVKKVQLTTEANFNRKQDLPKIYGMMTLDKHVSDDSRNRLEEDEDEWEEIQQSQCPVKLLTKMILTHIGEQMAPPDESERAKKNVRDQYLHLKQGPHEGVQNFAKRFELALKQYDALHIDRPSVGQQVQDFLSYLDQTKHGGFKTRLDNAVVIGEATYPVSVAAAMKMAKAFVEKGGHAPPTTAVFVTKQPDKKRQKKNPKPYHKKEEGEKEASDNPDKPVKKYSDLPCPLMCGEKHQAHKCPRLAIAQQAVKDAEKGNKKVHVQRSIKDDENTIGVFAAKSNDSAELTPNHILSDNQAEGHMFGNSRILENLGPAPNSNFSGIGSGTVPSTEAGNFLNVVRVAYAPASKVNVLSLSALRDEGHDCGEDKATDSYYWKLPCGYTLRFTRLGGLYALDYRTIPAWVRENANPRVYLTSVLEKRLKYTKKENDLADQALEVRKRMGFPGARAFTDLVRSVVKNVPVDARDVARMLDVHGEAPEFIKGKMKKKNSPNADYNPIPLELSRYVALHVDIMFAKGLSYLVAVATPIGVCIVVFLGNAKNPDKFKDSLKSQSGQGPGTRSTATIKAALDGILRLLGSYSIYGRRILSDREGGILALQHQYPSIPFDPSGAAGHEPVVENRIRSIKATMRAVQASLPFKLCAILCVWLTLFAVYVGNRFPVRGGYEAAPISLVTGRQPDYKIDFPFSFGDEAYVHVTTNSTDDDRAQQAVALLPKGSKTGSAQFMLMSNGHIVTSSNFKLRPYSHEYVAVLNALHERYPPPSEDITIRVGSRIVEDTEPEDAQEIIDAYQPPQRQVLDRLNPEDLPVNPDSPPRTPDPDPVNPVPAPESNPPTPVPSSDSDPTPQTVEPPAPSDMPELVDSDDEDDNAMPSFTNLGRRATSKHIHPKDGLAFPTLAAPRTKSVFQMTINKAIRQNPEPAIEAAFKEVKQMVTKDVLEGTLWEDIPPHLRDKIVPSFMFAKDKIDAEGIWERLKARLICGGNFQIRELFEKHSSPTASVPSIFAIAAIAAAENLDVSTLDIGGAYLNADMGEEKVYMRLDQVVTSIMCFIDPDFTKFVRKDGTSIVRLKKALYGSIQAGLLWYKEISQFLISQGFQADLKNPCIFVKYDADGKVLLSLFVDDLKIVTDQPDKVKALHQALVARYGEVKIHTGQVHNYLGMQFDYSTPGQCTISMRGYIEKLLQDWSDYLHGPEVTTPAPESLFQVNPDAPALSEDDRHLFHSTTAMILYLATRVRPDLLLVVAFLATRVSCADRDDFRKLIRAIRYISETRELPLILKPNDLKLFVTYIDTAYGLHMDGKSHSGIIQTLGSAMIHARSVKQHIVTKSSAESELVGLSDLAGDPIAMRELLQFLSLDQGPAVIMQDNQATMKMVSNGKSTSNRTKHINIRYFWLKDRVDQGEVKLDYCPTEDMVADILTKPLQGAQFLKLRAKLLGHEDTVYAR